MARLSIVFGEKVNCIISEENLAFLETLVQEELTMDESINYLLDMGRDSIQKSNKDQSGETKVLKEFDFVHIQMDYLKSGAKSPIVYDLKLKQLYVKDKIHYIKAIKQGEKRIKSFRVDRIMLMRINEMAINDPLSFLLKGVISDSL